MALSIAPYGELGSRTFAGFPARAHFPVVGQPNSLFPLLRMTLAGAREESGEEAVCKREWEPERSGRKIR